MTNFTTITSAEKPSERTLRIASKVAKLRSLVLPFPPQQQLIADLDEMYQTGQLTKGQPQEAMLVLQPTGAGKTTAAQLYIQRLQSKLPPGSTDKPAILARCAAAGSSKTLVASLLDAVDARYRFGLTEQAMWKAWSAVTHRFKVGLIFVDEVQHCQDAKFSGSVSNTIKNCLSNGGPPMVLLGTRKGEALFTTNDELNSRIYAPISLEPQNWHVDADRALWIGFSRRLDEAMVAHGIVTVKAGLGDEPLAERLCEASLGRIGLLKKIVQAALRVALRRGANAIDIEDLRNAIQLWSIQNRFIAYNPLGNAA